MHCIGASSAVWPFKQAGRYKMRSGYRRLVGEVGLDGWDGRA